VQKGATACNWSGNGLKAYFGSAGGNVVVGTYDDTNDWWHCKAIDRHASTVTGLAPHPSVHTVLATAGHDSTIFLLSTLTRAVDGKPADAPKFGTVLAEIPLNAWIHDLTWNTAGTTLAAATHDSRVTVITFPSSTLYTEPVLQVISLRSLPLRTLAFVSPSQLVGAGFDFMAVHFSTNAKGNWVLSGKWVAETAKRVNTEAELAREKFQNQASTGQAAAVELPTTRHKNVITKICVLKSSEELIPLTSTHNVFATGSMDGRVEYWDMKSMVPE
jgi:WD40 repeat protein